jgi:glucan biosynthesis protein C
LSTIDGKKPEQIIVEAPQNGDRVYGLDAARAVLMIAGIPYHAALPFSDADWLIELQPVPFLGWLSWTIHLVRMPAFFFISGILSAIVVSRRGKSSWIRNRNSRLGYPLLFGVFVLNYAQLILLKKHENYGYVQAVLSAFPGHFWFIIVLLILSYLYYLTHPIVEAVSSRAVEFSGPMSARTYVGGIFLVSALTAVINLIDQSSIVAMTTAYPGAASLLYGLAMGFPYFLAGLVLVHLKGLSQLRFRKPVILIVILVGSMVSYYLANLHGKAYTLEASRSLLSTASVALIMFIFCRYMNRRSVRINKLVSASFCIYIVHHPLIVLLYTEYSGGQSSYLLNFALIAAASLIGSYIIWVLGRDVPVVSSLIGAR